MSKSNFTFGNNALNADHGANKLREKFPGSDTARNKGALKAHQNLLSFLKVFWVDTASSFCDCVTEWLNVLTGIPEHPLGK